MATSGADLTASATLDMGPRQVCRFSFRREHIPLRHAVWHIYGASAGLLWCLMLFAEREPLTRSTPQSYRISYAFGKRYEGRTHTMQRSRGSPHCTSDGGGGAPQSGWDACAAGCIWS